MAFKDVYINSVGAYLPNEPISNANIESYLDTLGDKPLKKLVLNANGIEHRYYALNDKGEPTHLTEDLAYYAAMEAIELAPDIGIGDIDLMSFGTANSDLILPSLSHQLHALFGERTQMGPIELLPTTGVCLAGITSLRGAFSLLRNGERSCAIVGGAERPSIAFRKSHYLEEQKNQKENSKEMGHTYSFGQTQFLRWMLSDGGGATVLSTEPNSRGLTLKIDWVEMVSFSNETPLCMWLGAGITDYTVKDTWWSHDSFNQSAQKGALTLRQDAYVLADNILKKGEEGLKALVDRGRVNPEEISWILPHLSSFAFQDEFMESLKRLGFSSPEEKWFTNLKTKGNTGSAAIFIMLEEAFNSGLFKAGDKILLIIPESAHFNYGYVQLTCV